VAIEQDKSPEGVQQISVYNIISNDLDNHVKPRPNDRNMPTQLIAMCCVRLATVLQGVATSWVLLAGVCKWSNLSQQHPTYCNTVAKRTQHVAPNNVAICCVGMLQSFGRGLRHFVDQMSLTD